MATKADNRDDLVVQVLETLDECRDALFDRAQSFTCSEAAAIVRLFEAARRDADAHTFLALHAAGDVDGDAHYTSEPER